jgi:hypothetical protein
LRSCPSSRPSAFASLLLRALIFPTDVDDEEPLAWLSFFSSEF